MTEDNKKAVDRVKNMLEAVSGKKIKIVKSEIVDGVIVPVEKKGTVMVLNPQQPATGE